MAWGESEWYEWILNPGGSAIAQAFPGTNPDNVKVPSTYQDATLLRPYAAEELEQKALMRAIASGQVDSPGVEAMMRNLNQAGNQAYGAARGAPIANAAAQGRLMRGAQGATQQISPELLGVGRLQAQQAARGQLADTVAMQRAREEEEAHRRREEEAKRLMAQVNAVNAERGAVTAGSRAVTNSVLGLLGGGFKPKTDPA